jgi:hypothetical protein
VEVSRAKALRDVWKSQGNPPCPHTGLDVESTVSGYFTGHYVCKACGEYVQIEHHALPSEPHAKSRASWGRYAVLTSMGLLAAAVPVLTVWYKRRRRKSDE